MIANQFTLPVVDSNARKLTTGWLLLGLVALVIGGLYTILVVLSRTPFFQEIIPWVDFFRTALVVHVNLTVLVWFLAFAGVFWSYTNSQPDGAGLVSRLCRGFLELHQFLALPGLRMDGARAGQPRHANHRDFPVYRREPSVDEQLCAGTAE